MGGGALVWLRGTRSRPGTKLGVCALAGHSCRREGGVLRRGGFCFAWVWGGGVAAFHGVSAGGVGVAFVWLMLGGVGRFGGFFIEY